MSREHPRGHARRPEGLRRIIVSFDVETFEEVCQRAEADGTSFAAEARMLVEVGLETLKADGQ